MVPSCLCHPWRSHGLSLIEDRCGGEVETETYLTECEDEPFLVREVSREIAAALITLVLIEIVSVIFCLIDMGTVHRAVKVKWMRAGASFMPLCKSAVVRPPVPLLGENGEFFRCQTCVSGPVLLLPSSSLRVGLGIEGI